MSNWFECKVKYDKMMENGLPKSVSEPYLVDALSFTEAEARIIEEMIISTSLLISKSYSCAVLFMNCQKPAAPAGETTLLR